VRLLFLKAVCAVAEGADVPLSHAVPDASSSRCPPDVCVGAVLGDALRRVAVLGGREGMPRSLGSVYAGSVTRFLGGLRGVVSRVVATPDVVSDSNGVAVSRDGCMLLVSDGALDASHAIHVYDTESGCALRVIGGPGDGPLQFSFPKQVYIAPDDFVFVADRDNHRVQVLTPTLDFHGFVGVGVLQYPAGVCVNAAVVVVSECVAHRIAVFNRRDGALARRFGSAGRGPGELMSPRGLCFMSGDRHVAVAEYYTGRVSVFSIDGEFIRHVGVGKLKYPCGVVCSAFNELVVTNGGNGELWVRVFSDVGELLMTFGCADFSGVALHGSTLWATDVEGSCTVFS
jgi:DNA-binding beta-propeller fold protein YncE